MIFTSFESQYAISYRLLLTNLGPILHRLATIHPWHTDGQTDGRTRDNPCHKHCMEFRLLTSALLWRRLLSSSSSLRPLCSRDLDDRRRLLQDMKHNRTANKRMNQWRILLQFVHILLVAYSQKCELGGGTASLSLSYLPSTYLSFPSIFSLHFLSLSSLFFPLSLPLEVGPLNPRTKILAEMEFGAIIALKHADGLLKL